LHYLNYRPDLFYLKAQKKASENVEKFLKERREQEIWEKISAVFQFHRDKQTLRFYSELHKWALDYIESDKQNEEPSIDLPTTNETNAMEMTNV